MNALLQQYAKINDKQKIDWSKQFIVLKYAKQISQTQYPNLNIDTLLVVALYHLDYDKTLDESVEDYISLFNYDNAKQAKVNVNPTIFIFDSNNSQQAYLWRYKLLIRQQEYSWLLKDIEPLNQPLLLINQQ